ncbi:hypothetical protein C7999DRAFT_45028 [Corynascus novoguineensis]|uniref:Uncharacterized protein n=1 Tax=Corynascus novoguineensis TaxID=1126955 RepID=A0AAN7CJ83_9PEZI|nr:hypothetical protein C7999DRAFT_45028 [Corynascus novoguineensis]
MMKRAFYAAAALLANRAAALPQAIPPSPCTTTTKTQLGIHSSVTNFAHFMSSMNQHWSTSGVPFSGTERIYVYTSIETYEGGSFTGYYTYDAHALRSAGYSITTNTVHSVSCPPTSTPTLPPSPTGSLCSPHGDHWHCEPTTPPPSQSTPPAGECEPHGDHWHCPSGVPEPTTPPPSQSTTAGQTNTPPAGECEPHGDHWHCPPGVPEPTTPPPVPALATLVSVGTTGN